MNATELTRLAFRALEAGDAALGRRVLTEDHVNHMAADEPPACRQPGAPGFLATSAWLRRLLGAELRGTRRSGQR